jgi:hypothetical protein
LNVAEAVTGKGKNAYVLDETAVKAALANPAECLRYE